MILIDKARFKFLDAGRQIQIELPADKRVFRKGRSYAVGIHHNKPALCHAQILHVERYNDGQDKIALTIRKAETDEPRLLGKTGGYVTNTAAALPDEPEAVDEHTQTKITNVANERWREHTADPHRQHRDRVAREINEWRESLQQSPSPHIARKIRQLEHILASLNRDLAA